MFIPNIFYKEFKHINSTTIIIHLNYAQERKKQNEWMNFI